MRGSDGKLCCFSVKEISNLRNDCIEMIMSGILSGRRCSRRSKHLCRKRGGGAGNE